MNKLFAVTIRNISLKFLYSLLQVYLVHGVSFIFHLNVSLVSVCTRGFGYLLCWPQGRGKGLVCTQRFSFHEFYNFLLFNFLIFISFWKTFFLPTPFTHTHSHTHDPHLRPLPTTHDPRHLATLPKEGLIRRLMCTPLWHALIQISLRTIKEIRYVCTQAKNQCIHGKTLRITK